MSDEDLEEKLRKLAQEVDRVSDTRSDAPKRSQLLEQVEALRKKIENKQNKDPCYFTDKKEIPNELYQLVTYQNIGFEKCYNKVPIEKTHGPAKMTCKWGKKFYRAKSMESHIEDIKRGIMSNAKRMAVEGGFGAVLVEEDKMKIVSSLTKKEWDMCTYGDVKYSVSAIAELYALKGNG